MLLASTTVVNAQQARTEKDLLGEKQILADAYYGVQTARALENFKLSGVKINHYPDLSKPGPLSNSPPHALTLRSAR